MPSRTKGWGGERVVGGWLAGLAAALCACSADPCRELGGGPRAYDAVSYQLRARFDWDAGRLVAQEDATLALCPGAGTTVELDSRVEVSRVRAGSQVLPFTVDPDAGTLRVDLSAARPGSEPVTLRFDYQAPTSGALVASTSTDEDPVRSRVLFTDSEPRAGHRWLVEKDDPADRALFSAELEVGPGEDAVANGERLLEVALDGGARRIGYALEVPIPTYLMAFALGELEHADRTRAGPDGGLPLAVWYRRGLVLEPGATLDAIEGVLDTFEPLLGPFPFRRYAVVLLPLPFRGGMENATITFDTETSGQGVVSRFLVAHETGHQWFGDWVTMKTYDDVWVKEGMATLLETEDDRPNTDFEARGRLLANYLVYRPGDAIVDRSLTGLDKYTSGPYQRAAALMTEIRALVGEAAFWAGARRFLATHARGSATGEDFIRSFAPALDEGAIRRLLASLPHTRRPRVVVLDLGVSPTLRLDDPGEDLHAPYTLTAVDPAGAGTVHTLAAGVPFTVDLSPQGYLAPDERDTHPRLDILFEPDDAGSSLGVQLVQGVGLLGTLDLASDAGRAFLSRSPAHQERALWADYPQLPIGAEEDLAGTLAALDSSYAREQLLLDACLLARSRPGLVAPVVAALQHPPRERNFAYDRCPGAVARAMEPEFLALAADAGVAELGRLEYLMSFRYADAGVAAMHALAVGAPTRRLRVLARSFETRPPAPLREDGPVEAGKAWWDLEDAPRPGPPDARLLEGKGARAEGR